MNRRHLLMIVALAGTLGATWWAAGLEEAAPRKHGEHAGSGRRAPKAAAANAERIQFDLPRQTIVAEGQDLFPVKSFAPPPPEPPKPPPPPPPSAPPLPFRYLGGLFQEGENAVFLGEGPRTHIVHAGDVIEGRYKVESVSPQKVTFVYVPLDQHQELVIGKP